MLAATALALWGLLLLHRGRGAEKIVLIGIAGLLALLVGLVTALCTGYHLVKYRQYLGAMSEHAMMEVRRGTPMHTPPDKKADNATAPTKNRGDEDSR